MPILRATLLTICLLLAACSDVVTTRYATRAEAQTDAVFNKGWLPTVIPPSSRNITVRNDPATDRAEGDFDFSPSDYPRFIRDLEAISSDDSSPWPPAIRQKLRDGYLPFAYISRGNKWLFLIHPDKGHATFHL